MCSACIQLFLSTEKVLEEGGDSIAPPARPQPTRRMSLLPDKPANLKGFSRVRRGTKQDNRPLDNATESEDGVDEPPHDDTHDDAADKSPNAADDNAAANSDDDPANNVEEGAEADDEDDADPNDGVADEDDDGRADDDQAEAILEDDTDAFAGARTPSPDLQGASRTTGGVFRGRAVGNVLNVADAVMMSTAEDPGPAITGRVLIYENKTDNEPAFTMKHIVTSDLRPILTRLAEKHPPIRSESLLHVAVSITLTIA